MAEIDSVLQTEHAETLQKVILSSLCSSFNSPEETADRFVDAISTLKDEFFSSPQKQVWQIICRHYGMSGTCPSSQEFSMVIDLARNLDVASRVRFITLYDEIVQEQISTSKFKFSCKQLVSIWRDQQVSKSLMVASQIQSSGVVVDGKKLSGPDDAIGYFQGQVANVESLSSVASSGAYISAEGEDFLSSYQKIKENTVGGVLSGFDPLDRLTRGFQPGELIIIGGFTGEGKSKICYNIAYHAAFVQKKNVIFGTLEATRDQVRRNIVVRHSHHEKFGLIGGMNYSKVKWATLNGQEEEKLVEIVKDMRDGDYGRLYTFQLPYRATIDHLNGIILQQTKVAPIDLIIIDYAGLMTSSSKRASRREELDDLVVALKRLATDYNGGKGVPVITPWQLTREAWKEAVKNGGEYDKASFSETSQVEKSADLLLTLMAQVESPTRLKCQVVKYRDGESNFDFSLIKDFATSLVASDNGATNVLI